MKPSEFLENIGRRLPMYINPVNLQNLRSLFDGFDCGFALAKENLHFHDVTDAMIEAWQARGWKVNSFGPEKEMKERGMSETEIIEEFVQIQIQTWKILETRFLIIEKEL